MSQNSMVDHAFSLEPREVFDGAFAPAVSDAAGDADPKAETKAREPAAGPGADPQTPDGAEPGAAPDAAPKDLVFIDVSIDGADAIAAGIDQAKFDVLWLEPGQDGLAQIGQVLEATGDVASVQIISHATDGALRLGTTVIEGDGFDALKPEFEAWAGHLAEDAQILFYGCDLAETETGQALLHDIAAATGAGVAASIDATGAASLGGDWDLEFSTEALTVTQAATAEDMAGFDGVLAAEPTSTISAIDPPLLGESFTFSVTFDNASAVDTGYTPYINLILPTAGADGIYDTGTETFTDSADGITLDSATFFGQAVETQSAVIVDGGGGTLVVEHPITGEIIGVDADLNLKAGDTLYTLALPFGSFTPDQPAATVDVTATLSGDADLTQPLSIVTNAGFALGNDALDNPMTDPPIQSATFAASNTNATSVTPQLYKVETDFSHPEGDTATGPNFVRSTTITVTVAPGQPLSGADVEFTLPEQLVYVSATAPGGSLSAAPAQDDGGITTDDTITASYASLAGINTFTVNYYVAETDQDGTAVLDPVSGDDFGIDLTDAVRVTGAWTATDGRDGMTVADSLHSAESFTAKALDLDKSVTTLTAAENRAGER